MHVFFAKIARFAFSKGAAFCYAVTVGVSGQLAYNYVQPRDPAPAAVASAVPPAAMAAKPAPAPPAATAPLLRDLTAASLPNPGAMSAPALKPATLPASRPNADPAASPEGAPEPPAPAGAATAALPPLGGGIEVMPSPAGPVAAIAGPVSLLPLSAAPEAEKTVAPVRPGPGSGGLY